MTIPPRREHGASGSTHFLEELKVDSICLRETTPTELEAALQDSVADCMYPGVLRGEVAVIDVDRTESLFSYKILQLNKKRVLRVGNGRGAS